MARKKTTEVPSDAPAEPPGPAAYTIDQLSQRTGVPGRTIRFYQSQGVLPSPRRQGRLAYYDDDHVQRLHLIAELRDKGLRLDAIRDALEQLESGSDSLHHWLGLSDRFADSWAEDRPVLMTSEELAARYGGLRRGLLADLEAVGLIRREATGVKPTYLVQSLTFVDNLLMLESVGVDMSVSVEAALKIRRVMATLIDELVADFVAYFRDDLLSGGTDGPERAVKAVEKLRPAGLDTLRITFGEEVDRAIRGLVQGGPKAIDEMVNRRTQRENAKGPKTA